METTTTRLPNNETLLRTIEEETFRQVRDLSVSVQDNLVDISGESRSYYVKQLVTRAVRAVAPQVRLTNNIAVNAG